MPDMNNIEIIQNKIDALVDKIIQKENSDEDFRITYAQILEKINTKIDLFSNNDNFEKLGMLSVEIRNMLNNRQLVVDGKFSAIKAEFDGLHELVSASVKTPELIALFDKLQNQIHYFVQEQEKQKSFFDIISSELEKLSLIDGLKDDLRSNFAIVKEQNVISNENIAKQLAVFSELNSVIEANNQKTLENINTIIFALKDFETSLNDDVAEIRDHFSATIDGVISKIQETDSFVEIMNNNLTTMMQVVGNLFEDEPFQDVQSDLADILVKITFLSDTLKSYATKAELMDEASKNKEELKNNTKDLILELQARLIEKLDLLQVSQINETTTKLVEKSQVLNETSEKILLGTESLKDDIWTIKDNVAALDVKLLSKNDINECLDVVKTSLSDEIIDVISTESCATSEQIRLLSDKVYTDSSAIGEKLEALLQQITLDVSNGKDLAVEKLQQLAGVVQELKDGLFDLILNKQQEKFDDSLSQLQTKFLTQLIQVADNISFDSAVEEISDTVCVQSDTIIEQLQLNIATIRQELAQYQESTFAFDKAFIEIIERIDNSLQENVSDKIDAFVSDFNLFAKGKESEEIAYTLPDIESDLSKISAELSHLQKLLVDTDSENVEDGSDLTSKLAKINEKLELVVNSPINDEIQEVKSLFGSLNEDVTSISQRTNKLILTSDNVNKTLKKNIETFTDILACFERQSLEFYRSTFLRELSAKVDNLAKSNDVITEAFMYLGEWVDSTSETFSEIKSDIEVVKNCVDFGSEDVQADDIDLKINNISDKILEQESKIEAIDAKLDKVLICHDEAKDIKALMEYIATQVSVTNEKLIGNDELAQKVSSMEKQLKKIEKSVGLITEYLDEDDV